MILRTERLTVRRLTSNDEHDMERLLSDPNVMEFSFAAPMNQAESKNYLQSAIDSYEEHDYGIYALSQVEDGSFIGYSGFTHYEDLDSQVEIELGYRLFPQFWGKGFATEASSALLNYGYDELGFKRIISLIRKGNEASIRVSTKVGAVPQKQLSINGHTALVYVYEKNN